MNALTQPRRHLLTSTQLSSVDYVPAGIQIPAAWEYSINAAGLSQAYYPGVVIPMGGGIPDAPSNANTYGRFAGTWVPVMPLSGGILTAPLIWAATGTPTLRSAQDRSADSVNVLDYGAVGDGTTDCTAAFNAAIATGHIIHVPRGTYLLGPITLNQGMYGSGMDATILQLRSGTTGMPIMISWTDPGSSTIRDLTIDGQSLASAGIMTGGAAANGLRIEDVEVRNIGEANATAVRYGIMINWDGTTTNMKSACVVSNCYVHDIVGAGITAGGQGHVIANNTIINCGHSGINCWGAMTDSVIANNTINTTGTNLSASSDGITGYAATNLRVLCIGNTVENSTNHGIHLGGNNLQVIGNKIHTVVNGSGIILAAAPNNAPTPGVTGVIANNEIDTVAIGGGIRCSYMSRVIVNGNSVSNIGTTSSSPGILFLISSDCVCSGNVVYNVFNDGIAADTGVNLIVSGNRISTVTGRGINDLGASTNMTVSGNIVTGEGTPTSPTFSGALGINGDLIVAGNIYRAGNPTPVTHQIDELAARVAALEG